MARAEGGRTRRLWWWEACGSEGAGRDDAGMCRLFRVTTGGGASQRIDAFHPLGLARPPQLSYTISRDVTLTRLPSSVPAPLAARGDANE